MKNNVPDIFTFPREPSLFFNNNIINSHQFEVLCLKFLQDQYKIYNKWQRNMPTLSTTFICANHSMDSPEFVHNYFMGHSFSALKKNWNIKKCPHELRILKLKIIYLFNLYLKQKTNLYNNYNNNLYKI